ncbi:FimV/HubP family polar landmark protein [Neisseria montereyensis]|uniref:LysM peptidoglycan-binding domain-containing protein n=1 Tax=Neisseria montereyensis TaxID=2973938 RepID=A0ABT2F9L1_9NEIS|nr:FimV/HubP family polar landmark protein [Neisseria montereyensis]MCS4532808.1 LysM peptidoglycan-binding domain-containing protein [Neisseria montereyensis]
MKNNHKIKLIAASLAFSTSLSAMGGLGGLSVQSNLGEPFSGSVTVTGEEAQILLNGGSASLSNNNLRTSVRKSGDNAVISIRSNAPVNDPVLVFQIGVGAQSRQYTAIIDPPDYSAEQNTSSNNANTQEVVADQTASRAQEQRRSSAQTNLREKKAQEQAKTVRRKPAVIARTNKKQDARRDTENVPDKQQQILRGNYTIRHGETLTSIAERVRPRGLSVHDTINALVAANPSLFPNQNPNLINAGKVLNIPSAQELVRLAQQPVATGEVKESAPSKQEQVEKTVSASAEATEQQSPETPSVAVENETPNETQDTTAIASAPVNAASEVPEMASEAVAEVSAEEEAASQSQMAPTDTAQEQQPASSGEEDSGWWRWLLFAGIAAIALWLLLKAAGKKKQTPDTIFADDVEVEDDIVLDSDISQDSNIFTDAAKNNETDVSSRDAKTSKDNVEPAVKAALVTTAATTAAASKPDDALNVEDDFDDDIFFTETEVVPVEKSGEDFNLDLGAIDKEQGAIVSSSLTQDEETQKRQNADWDKIESTESVYEPDPESEYQHIAVEFDANANKTDEAALDAEEQTDIKLDTEIVEADSVEAPKDGLQPLVEQVQEPADLEYEQPAIEISETTDTPSENKVSDIATAEADTDSLAESNTSVAAEQDDNALEFEIVGDQTSESESAPVQTVEQSEADVAAPAPLDFDIAETPAESDSVQFDTTSETVDVQDESVEETNLVTSSQDTVQEVKDDFVLSQDQQEGGISFQDSEDLSAPIELATADDTETIEWESISVEEEDNQSDGGFISESVGMTAPLEAKYELAQMYMEIGDPDAARETLQELLEESSGEILEKTQAMLAELNK